MLYSKKSLFKSQQQGLSLRRLRRGALCEGCGVRGSVVVGVVKSRQRPEGVSLVAGCGRWKAAADALATKVGAFTCLKSLLYARYVCAAGNTPHNVDVA